MTQRTRDADLLAVIAGRGGAPTRSATPTIVEGRIVNVTPGGAEFVLPDYDGGKHKFGPSPWARSGVQPGGTDLHDHEDTGPVVGAWCLVVFVPPGLRRSWIVGWW